MSSSSSDEKIQATPVILFKHPSEPVHSDSYLITLQPSYSTHFVPILADTFHLDQLVHTIQSESEWQGVIITSRRGAEGWIQAADQSTNSDVEVDVNVDWSRIPLWTVGTASIDALESAQRAGILKSRLSPFISSSRMAKSAKELIPLILDATPRPDHPDSFTAGRPDPAVSWQYTHKPYLIVRGDKSVEEIPVALKKAGKHSTEMIVYSTSARGDIRRKIESTLQVISDSSTTWLAFFSPSSAAFALEHLPTSFLRAKSTRILAIGETTKAYLEQRQLVVHAVARQPTAQGMLDALNQSRTI